MQVNTTKTIRTSKLNLPGAIKTARDFGYSYSALHSKVDEVLNSQELSNQLYEILKRASKRERKIVKLTEEEKAEYANDNTQLQAVSKPKLREYGIFK